MVEEEEDGDETISSLPANNLRGTFVAAYDVLTRILLDITWDELLGYRSKVHSLPTHHVLTLSCLRYMFPLVKWLATAMGNTIPTVMTRYSCQSNRNPLLLQVFLMEDEYTTFKQQPAMPGREGDAADNPLPDQASGFEPNPAMNTVTGEKSAAKRGA
jgi:hypothetical protein